MTTTIKGGFSTKNKDQMDNIVKSVFRKIPKKVEKTEITKQRRTYKRRKIK